MSPPARSPARSPTPLPALRRSSVPTPERQRALEQLGVTREPIPDNDERPEEREHVEAFDVYEAERAWRS